VAFGQKTGSLKNLKKSLAKGGGKGFIKYIPKNGSMNVRYIEEPENWVNYVEHYDQTIRKSYPCSGEANCPGCASGERKSSRYLANVVDLDDQNKRVVPLQMPKDLANRLVVKYEKWGSITDRDIELSRSGEGLDTVYDLDASVPDRKSIAKYQPIDLLKTLEDAYNAVFGDDEDEEEETVKPAVRGRGRSAAAKKATAPKGTTLDEDEEDEDEAPKPARKRAAKKAPAPAVDEDPEEDDEEDEDEEPTPAPKKRASKKAPEPEFEPDEDEDDEPEEDDEDGEDEDGFTEDDLRAMSFGVLRATARSFGVSTKGKNADEIIEEIMEAGEEEDDA
jgi:hypothetical protein